MGAGIGFAIIGFAWTSLLLYLYTPCSVLGRDISSGKLYILVAFQLFQGLCTWIAVQLFIYIYKKILFYLFLKFQARSLPSDKLRVFYISVNAAMYFIQVC